MNVYMVYVIVSFHSLRSKESQVSLRIRDKLSIIFEGKGLISLMSFNKFTIEFIVVTNCMASGNSAGCMYACMHV